MPGINLSVLSTTSLDQQLTAARQSNNAAPNSLRWPALFTAYQNAWDNRIGLQAQCRADDDTAIIKAEQKTELDRLRAGPDGALYTSDDTTTYTFDDNGNIYIDTPPTPTTEAEEAAGSAVAAGADNTDPLDKISKPLAHEQEIRVSSWPKRLTGHSRKHLLEAASPDRTSHPRRYGFSAHVRFRR
ncbi:hypothetical protein QV65_32135 [Rhodococcus erythropolis]|nr:hypothetical protein QV65_32135 [Rhodococcus erythropolis]